MGAGMNIRKMKSSSSETTKRIAKAAREYHSALGSKRTTRLKLSGVGKSGSLLHPIISKAHGELLFADYRQHIKSRFNQEQLRYFTLIHELVVMDKNEVIASCKRMKEMLKRRLKDYYWHGVIETEIVNLVFLRSLQEQEAAKKVSLKQKESMRHKLEVVNALDVKNGLHELVEETSSRVLVHCHVVIDMGKGTVKAIRERVVELRAQLAAVKVWNIVDRQIEIKRFSEQWRGKKRTLRQNIWHIANYGTKCGNEQLRYKAGFGRDNEEDEEAALWKAYGRDLISEVDGVIEDDGAVEDARGLTGNEVAFLNAVTLRLMRMKNDMRGYVIGSGVP